MIRPETIPRWPNDVILSQTAIFDQGLNNVHPISEVAFELLRRVDGTGSLKEISYEVSRQYGWEEGEVLHDFMELISLLNQNYVMNVKTPVRAGLICKDAFISILYFMKTLQGVKWDKKNRISIPEDASSFQTFLLFLGVITAVFGHFAAGFGLLLTGASFFVPFMTKADGIAVAAALLISFTLHEYGHYSVFQKMTRSQKRIFLATRRGGIQIVRPLADPRTEWVTSVSGPAIPLLTAGVVLAIYMLTPVLHFSTAILIIAVNAVHLISLLPFAEDGKRILQAWKTRKHELAPIKEEQS